MSDKHIRLLGSRLSSGACSNATVHSLLAVGLCKLCVIRPVWERPHTLFHVYSVAVVIKRQPRLLQTFPFIVLFKGLVKIRKCFSSALSVIVSSHCYSKDHLIVEEFMQFDSKNTQKFDKLFIFSAKTTFCLLKLLTCFKLCLKIKLNQIIKQFRLN